MNVYIPKKVSMMITLTQLLQMFMGTFIFAYVGYIKASGEECQTSVVTTVVGLLGYIWLVYLFGDLFYRTYIQKKSKDKLQ